jgi:hypothetical protein
MVITKAAGSDPEKVNQPPQTSHPSLRNEAMATVPHTTWNVKLFFRLSWTEVLQGHKDL